MLAVVLTGAPGAGKSSVLTALADALSDDDIPHAAVEVEALVLKRAVSADEYLFVRLEAPPATLVERIVDCEPESWSGLPELVEHARQLAAGMPALCGIDLVVSTEGQRPETVAQRIRDAHPVRLLTPPAAR